MGYHVGIGRLYLDTRDSESHVWLVEEEYCPESPQIPGVNSFLNGYNQAMASYTGMRRLCEAAELMDVFYPDDRDFCGIQRYVAIDAKILDALDRAVKVYPEKAPHEWWRIAMLEWMWYWSHRAYRNHHSPVIHA